MSGKMIDPVVVGCPRCRRYYRIPGAAARSPRANLRCAGCGFVFSLEDALAPAPEPAGRRVLLATDGEEVQGVIEEVLHQGGFTFQTVREGGEVLQLLETWQPQATVLDVGISGMPVFEVCDQVRNSAKYSRLPIILLASVYQHTRYKRSPTSLYGADDYIEKHHLRDSLLDKIERLLAERGDPSSAREHKHSPRLREEAREGKDLSTPALVEKEEEAFVREEQFGPSGASAAEEDRLHDNLRRFARIIVSDIALYNQELIERGVREGTTYQLLGKEIREGLALYQTRLSPNPGCEKNFYREAFEAFIVSQKARFPNTGGGDGR